MDNQIQDLNNQLDLAGYLAIIALMALLYAAYRYLKSLDGINFQECEKCGSQNKHECEYYGCGNSTEQL
jgi:hypothetical protein